MSTLKQFVKILHLIAFRAISILIFFPSKRATYHLGSEMTGHLQLAPSVDHQVSAMLSILDRYNWRQFGILTSEVAGHGDFVQAVRDQVQAAAKHGRRSANLKYFDE